MIVITAILLVVLLGLAAMTIDMGSFYQTQAKAQSAADAAALAAADNIAGGAASATTAGASMATTNLPGATATVTTPYNGNANEARVTVNTSAPATFGRLFGMSSASIGASAIAKTNTTTSPYGQAIFAADTSCSGVGVEIFNSTSNVQGGITSNGHMQMSFSSSTFGPITYGGPNNCSGQMNYSSVNYLAGPPQKTSATATFPVDYRNNPPTCTQSASTFDWYTSTVNLNGVYCATNSIQVSASTLSGSATLIAPSIQISVSSCTMTPYPGTNNLLLWQTGSGTLLISLSNLNGGTIFAPSAEIQIDASSATDDGFIEGNDVFVSDSSFTMTGTGPAGRSTSSGSSLVG